MTFETTIDKINMRIRAVYVSGQSDLGLRISPTECIIGNSSQSVLFTLKKLLCFCSGSNKNKRAVPF